MRKERARNRTSKSQRKNVASVLLLWALGAQLCWTCPNRAESSLPGELGGQGICYPQGVAPGDTNSSPDSSELHILCPECSSLSLSCYSAGRAVVGSDTGQGVRTWLQWCSLTTGDADAVGRGRGW